MGIVWNAVRCKRGGSGAVFSLFPAGPLPTARTRVAGSRLFGVRSR